MRATGKNPYSLYFHLPFCRRKCPYCHFFVLPDKVELKDSLLEALELEWKSISSKREHKELVSIYFGGGTPTLMGPAALEKILKWIEIPADCEITLEANPEEVTLPLMQAFAAVGINRVSIGVQSLDDSSLNTLERQHTAKKALLAIENTYQAGISNISIDLMYDLPGQTLTSWEKTLAQVQHLPITHLSLYNLTIEPHTAFFKRKKELIPLLPSPDTSLAMLEAATSSLTHLKRYEISAFAKPGFASRHNTGYWTGRPFLGLGPSAFSYWDKKRFRNAANLSHYAKALQKGDSPIDFEEELPYPDSLNELLAIHLRLLEGVDLTTFSPLPEATHQALLQLEAQGWLILSPTRAQLTAQGLLFYDSVAEALI
jgi:oxygen-independent coproporphyrinogen-3 oxidase